MPPTLFLLTCKPVKKGVTNVNLFETLFQACWTILNLSRKCWSFELFKQDGTVAMCLLHLFKSIRHGLTVLAKPFFKEKTQRRASLLRFWSFGGHFLIFFMLMSSFWAQHLIPRHFWATRRSKLNEIMVPSTFQNAFWDLSGFPLGLHFCVFCLL